MTLGGHDQFNTWGDHSDGPRWSFWGHDIATRGSYTIQQCNIQHLLQVIYWLISILILIIGVYKMRDMKSIWNIRGSSNLEGNQGKIIKGRAICKQRYLICLWNRRHKCEECLFSVICMYVCIFVYLSCFETGLGARFTTQPALMAWCSAIITL